jgi:hypothetical protein
MTREFDENEINREAWRIAYEEEAKAKAEKAKTNGGFRDANAERRRAEAARKADEYCNKTGGPPDNLGAKSPAEYGKDRDAIAEATGIAKAFLDEEYRERRKAFREEEAAEAEAAKTSFMEEPEPWPEPVNGAQLLDRIVEAAKSHVILPDGGAETIALWSVHAHAHDAFDVSPFLTVTSPVQECGKSTVMRLVAALVPKALPASNISPSALFRAIDKWHPTLLIDEADSFLPDNESLRGVLNAGHAKGASIVRNVGDDHEPQQFSTWSPKAIALIGRLAPTLASRSIHLELRRKYATERVTKLRIGKTGHLTPLLQQAARWALDNFDLLRAADPQMPASLEGRVEDNWLPMIAIADLAGGDWPERARRIACKGAVREDETDAIVLLGDLRVLYAERGVDRLTSKDVVNHLGNMEDRKWSEWGRQGKPISQTQLAALLRPFKIYPRDLRIESERGKGYRLDWFKDVFQAYLPPLEPRRRDNPDESST